MGNLVWVLLIGGTDGNFGITACIAIGASSSNDVCKVSVQESMHDRLYGLEVNQSGFVMNNAKNERYAKIMQIL